MTVWQGIPQLQPLFTLGNLPEDLPGLYLVQVQLKVLGVELGALYCGPSGGDGLLPHVQHLVPGHRQSPTPNSQYTQPKTT